MAIALAANPENRALGLASYAWQALARRSVRWCCFGDVVTHDAYGAGGMMIGALRLSSGSSWLAGTYEIIPGFIFGSIGIVVFSLLGKAPSAAMQKRFAEADAHYHSAPPSRLQES
ncbi:hypothetical protein ACLK19_07080 [Escherichia coli]